MKELENFVGKTIAKITDDVNELTIIFTDKTELKVESNCYGGELEFNIWTD